MVQRAPLATAAWLARIIDPVVQACQFSGAPPPIELRPMRHFVGYASRLDPDRRVCIDKKSIFWSARSIVSVVVHEWAHVLVRSWEEESDHHPAQDAHGPVFLLVLMTLCARVDASKKAPDRINSLATGLSLYDFQDQPTDIEGADSDDQWRGLVLNWALLKTKELVEDPISAEDLPAKAVELWAQYVDNCKAKSAAAAKEKSDGSTILRSLSSQIEKYEREIEQLKIDVDKAGTSWSSFFMTLLILISFFLLSPMLGFYVKDLCR